ncbi:YIP1 family protein [Archangium sp.]|uniref:YIP1 family protein n=1 Tax=Archangium sp. TaxID=1872627 RepID=UPI00389AFAA8
MPPPGDMGPDGEPTPWERRSELGLVQGYWETWKTVMFNPEKFWNRASPQGSLWDALSFAWIVVAINSLLSLPFQFLQSPAQFQRMLDQMNSRTNMTPEMERMMTWFFAGSGRFALLVGGLLLYPLGFVIGAAITHLMCLLLGMSRNGFTATARAYGYASAPAVLTWVPCVGPIASFIYTLVLYVWGLARMQRASYGRSAVAVLGPIVLLFCCCCGLLALAASSLAAAMGRH